jgi:regulator of extracellular matrix RemA (YlzA/DUF370 family)
MQLLNVGFENGVVVDRIVAVIDVNSTPVKRMIEESKRTGMLIDATHGKKIRAVIVTDSNHCVISAIAAETLMARFTSTERIQDKKPKEKEPEKK